MGELEMRKNVADEHIQSFVNEQLERAKSNDGSIAVVEDEFEAQLDD
jgi:hypothetical protein